ncbi:MAG: hypothetical protein R3E03_02810 [Novosphingobium sp.]
MRTLPLLSVSLLALAACAPKEAAPVAVAPAPEAAPSVAPYAPVIPKGTGIFAEASSLPFQAPDFSKIKDSDYEPAIEQGIAIQLAEVDAIANDPDTPTFDNTIVALEKSGQDADPRALCLFRADQRQHQRHARRDRQPHQAQAFLTCARYDPAQRQAVRADRGLRAPRRSGA